MFDTITQSIKDGYQKLWDWSANAGTIVLARITALTGIFTAAISYMDWSPLWNLLGTGTEFNPKQGIAIGLGLFIKGVFDEIVRRSNTVTTAASRLISADTTMPEVKAVKKKQVKEAIKEAAE